MPIFVISEIQVKPEKLVQYEDVVLELVEAAKGDEKTQPWSLWQDGIGTFGRYHAVLPCETFAQAGSVESTGDLAIRLKGKKEGGKLIERINECVSSAEVTIQRDRPDLSYPPPEDERAENVLLTELRVQPGGLEEVLELLRKLSEAVPKTDDPRRFTTLVPFLGEIGQVNVVTSIKSPEDLDSMLPPDELLNQAFGAAEAGVVSRNAQQAMLGGRRSLVTLRQDLSLLLD